MHAGHGQVHSGAQRHEHGRRQLQPRRQGERRQLRRRRPAVALQGQPPPRAALMFAGPFACVAALFTSVQAQPCIAGLSSRRPRGLSDTVRNHDHIPFLSTPSLTPLACYQPAGRVQETAGPELHPAHRPGTHPLLQEEGAHCSIVSLLTLALCTSLTRHLILLNSTAPHPNPSDHLRASCTALSSCMTSH